MRLSRGGSVCQLNHKQVYLEANQKGENSSSDAHAFINSKPRIFSNGVDVGEKAGE